MDERLTRSRKQEKRGAKIHSGRVVAASGAGPMKKGDVRSADYLIEYKRTDKKSIAIEGAWLEKIRREALASGRRPMLGIEILGRDWILLPASDLPFVQDVLDGYGNAATEDDTHGTGAT